MTHCTAEEDRVVPYEVSLCNEPARPHCYTLAKFSSLKGALEYKGLLISGHIKDVSTTLEKTMAMQEDTKPTASKLQLALDSIQDEEQRNLISARLGDMMKFVDEAEKKAADLVESESNLRKQLECASKETLNEKIQADLLKSQLQTVTASLGQDWCQKYHLGEEVTNAAIDSGEFNRLAQLTERALMACSRKMMDAIQNTSKPKRQAEHQMTPTTIEKIEEKTASIVPASASTMPVVREEPKDMSPMDYLQRAMESTARSFRGTQVSSF